MYDINNIPDFDLIAKYLARETDEIEDKLIRQWIVDGNSQEFERIKQIWETSGIPAFNFDTEKALLSVNNRIKKNKTFRSLKWISVAAAAIILLIATPLLILNNDPNQPKTEYISKVTNENSKKIILDDGSNVTLNSNSKIEYPKDFSNNRTITLEGEAYFEVEHIDNEHKFNVISNNVNITVVGTKFNVNSDKENDFLKVSVTEGIVEVKIDKNTPPTKLYAGESLIIDLNTHDSKLDTLGTENNIYWLTQKIVFKNADLSELATTLSNIYGVEVIINLSMPEQYRLTTEFENQNLNDILKILELTLDIKTKKSGNSIYLTDGSN
jgi:ferric-dicitrate binding protein FerR (iron transport regulator)